MKSIIQTGKYCFLTGRTDIQLHKHHIFNGGLRKWSEENGLWVYLTWEKHRNLHDTNVDARRLKAIAQNIYEQTHSHEEFMSHVHENYSIYLTEEDRLKYCVKHEALDLSQITLWKNACLRIGGAI